MGLNAIFRVSLFDESPAIIKSQQAKTPVFRLLSAFTV